MLVDQVKETHAISSDTCVDHKILLLKYLSNHAFHNKRFQTLLKDKLVRSKATCSFNPIQRCWPDIKIFSRKSYQPWQSIENGIFLLTMVNVYIIPLNNSSSIIKLILTFWKASFFLLQSNIAKPDTWHWASMHLTKLQCCLWNLLGKVNIFLKLVVHFTLNLVIFIMGSYSRCCVSWSMKRFETVCYKMH